jgi:hypothetical protein
MISRREETDMDTHLLINGEFVAGTETPRRS